MKSLKHLIAATFMAIFLLAQPAFAHTVLISSDPAADATVEVMPDSISLTFAEELISIGDSNSISVLDTTGTEIASGKPEVTGAILSIKLNATDVIGMFKVNYRAVAADGHVINGEYQFTVSPKVITATNQNPPAESEQTTTSENKISIYLIISATLVVGGGLMLFFIWKRQSK